MSEQLAALIEAGANLGPRHHQIAMIRATILASLRALPKALAAATAPLAMDDACRREAEGAVQSFTEAAKELIRRTEPPLASALTGPEASHHGCFYFILDALRSDFWNEFYLVARFQVYERAAYRNFEMWSSL